MEKKEARIKCNGCGTTFKVKVPVTDKPVGFKCKKCGKQLKIRVAPTDKEAPASQAAPPAAQTPPAPGGSGSFDSFDGFDGFEGADAGASAGQQGAAQAAPADEHFDDNMFGGFDGANQAPPQASAGPSPSGAPAEPAGSMFESGGFGDGPAPDSGSDERVMGFETTQLPDDSEYQDTGAPPPVSGPVAGADIVGPASGFSEALTPKWMVLSGDMVTGPFTDDEVTQMIKDQDISPDTSIRMGERPWIRAVEVGQFRSLFPESARLGAKGGAPAKKSAGVIDSDEEEILTTPFHQDIPGLLPYPVSGGQWQPFVIFVGIAFVLSAALCFNVLIGIPLAIGGWILLYGYLGNVMAASAKAPAGPPPAWDFAQAGQMAKEGASIFGVIALFSLVPWGIMLLLMILFFLNAMTMLGYLFMALTVLVYIGSLFVIPAALVMFRKTGNLGSALNPGQIMAVIGSGASSYGALAGITVAVGLACMLVTILSVFLTDIPVAGAIVSGLLMAIVFAYGHFVWFHVVGRFAGESGGFRPTEAASA